MAYLGNVPARSFISFERQVFTIVNSQTAYTLSHSVTNENDIRLVVNNVVQEPGSGKAYTATGTALTLSAALTNGTDEMYCVFLGRAVGTVNAPAGSVDTAQLAADAVTNAKVASTVITGQTAETSIATDDLILLSDTSASGALKKMTRANFVSGVGGTNTPAFHATNSATQDLTSGSYTKVAFNTETYDDGGVYDHSSNYRFTPGETGRFFIYYRLGLISSAPAENKYPYLQYGRLYQDGSQSDLLGELFIKRETSNYNFQEVYLHAAGVVNVTSASTYFELYALSTNAAGAGDTDVNTGSYFGAFKLIQ